MRLLEFLVVLLKLVGGFPFRQVQVGATEGAWRRHDNHQKASWTKPPIYERSSLWAMWTSVVCVAVVVYVVMFIMQLCNEDPKIFSVITFGIVNVVKDVTQMLLVVSVTTYLVLRKSMALELVSELQTLLRSGGKSHNTRRRNPMIWIILPLFLASGLILFVTIVLFYCPAMFYKMMSETFGAASNLLLCGFTMSFYFASVTVLCDAYDAVTEKLSRRILYPGPRMAPRVFTFKTASVSDVITTTDCREGIVREASETLLSLHELLLLLHHYMGFPITMVMQASVTSAILNIFFFTFWNTLNLHIKCFLVMYMTVSVLPLVALCNAPQMLETRVRHLRSFTRCLLRRETNEHLKVSYSSLLEILEDFPGFEMCSLFTLGRARLVDIFSFVATYVIILLQFRVSEGFDKTLSN